MKEKILPLQVEERRLALANACAQQLSFHCVRSTDKENSVERNRSSTRRFIMGISIGGCVLLRMFRTPFLFPALSF